MTVYQILGLSLTAISIILAFYTIVNRQNTSFKEELNKRFEALTTRVETADRNSAVGFEKVSGQFQVMTIQINTILEDDIRELRLRLGKLESGQDDWTRELRDRTHTLSNQLEKFGFELELLKIKCKDIK